MRSITPAILRRVVRLAGIISGVLFLIGAAPVNAAFQVERNEYVADFPDGMKFKLTVSADRPIEEVELHYYIGASEILQRTIPEFSPGRRLEIDWTLETGRINYLPPMIEIRYEFELFDDRGDRFVTPQRTVIYSDDRFDWRTVEADGLQLWYYNGSRSRAQQVADDARARVAVMEELFQTRLEAPVRGVVYVGRDIQQALAFRSDTTSAEGHFGGEAFVAGRVFTISGLRPGGIAHETTHLLLADFIERESGIFPSWLNEGLAQFADVGQPTNERSFSRGLRLDRMLGVPSRRDDINLHYAQSYSTVAFLLRTYGDEAMRRFIADIGSGTPLDDAGRAALGADIRSIDAAWRESVGLSPPPAPAAGEAAAEAGDAGNDLGGAPDPAIESAELTEPQITDLLALLALAAAVLLIAAGATAMALVFRRRP